MVGQQRQRSGVPGVSSEAGGRDSKLTETGAQACFRAMLACNFWRGDIAREVTPVAERIYKYLNNYKARSLQSPRHTPRNGRRTRCYRMLQYPNAQLLQLCGSYSS